MLWWIILARSWHVLVRCGIATIAVSAATALRLPFEVGFPGKPFVLYLVAVVASALLGRTPGFLAVVESSIACGLFFQPICSLRVTYAIDLTMRHRRSPSAAVGTLYIVFDR